MTERDPAARGPAKTADADAEWLQALVSDWQMIADLAFSDLVLWAENTDRPGLRATAQIRPTTGPTALLEDVVGTVHVAGRAPLLEEAFGGANMVHGETDALGRTTQAVPVRRDGRTIAVVERRRAAPGLRGGGALESAYLGVADDLFEMIRSGEFPGRATRTERADSLRVGDGLVRTDAAGRVAFASPNALSAYRRLGLVGELVGGRLDDITAGLLDHRDPGHGVPGLLAGGAGGEGEIENAAASLLVRVIALTPDGTPAGSLILLRDVTELRLRERELLSKDATIREIHHRVKNNLQTVAALLRLQGRRLNSDEARHALDEAVRRVRSIALVHETLSQSFGDEVDFDPVVDRLLRTVLDVAAERPIRAERVGSFGSLPGEAATPLAMALTELIQNAVEHAFGPDGGRLTISANRIKERLRIRVSDDGTGLGDDFSAGNSLGLSIVTTLIETELHGTLEFGDSRGHSASGRTSRRGGTIVSISLEV